MQNLVSSNKHRISNCSIHIEQTALFQQFDSSILCIGSCFAEAVASHLSDFGFDTYYNKKNCYRFSAKSLADYLNWVQKDLEEKQKSREHNFVVSKDNRLVRSLRHSDVFDAHERIDELELFCHQLDLEFIEKIQKAELITVTLGTSKYLQDRSTGMVVTNAGALDPDNRTIVDPDTEELTLSIESIIKALVNIGGDSKTIMFTVSPQRYSWQPIGDYADDIDRPADNNAISTDGLVVNSSDKSRLRVCLEDVLKKYQKSVPLIYFPSYEIVLDELRHLENFGLSAQDYSHVSKDTSAYVIDRFANCYFSKAMKDFIERFNKDRRLLATLRFPDEQTFVEYFLRIVGFLKENQNLNYPASYIGKVGNALNAFPLKSEQVNECFSDLLGDTNTEASSDKDFQEIVESINRLPDDVNVAVYGVGDSCDRLVKHSTLLNKKIVAFVDRKILREGTIYGKALLPSEELGNLKYDKVLIAAVQSKSSIVASLLEKGLALEKIL